VRDTQATAVLAVDMTQLADSMPTSTAASCSAALLGYSRNRCTSSACNASTCSSSSSSKAGCQLKAGRCMG
jgi:hypothetical protein